MIFFLEYGLPVILGSLAAMMIAEGVRALGFGSIFDIKERSGKAAYLILFIVMIVIGFLAFGLFRDLTMSQAHDAKSKSDEISNWTKLR